MISVVKLTIGHLEEFLKNAREIDLEEVRVASGKHFREQPLSLLYASYAIVHDRGGVLGIAGLDYLGNRTGAIWLLMTKAVERHPVEFLRWSKRYLEETLFESCDTLTNVVYAQNQLHIAWLDWLGAKWLGEAQGGRMFVLEKDQKE